MSVAAYAIGVRNYLRENLTNFYSTSQEKARNCKAMINDRPTADCGQEFIGIYGSSHRPPNRNLMQALEEEVGLTVCISRKIAVIPPDYRGELGYLSRDLPTSVSDADETRFLENWASTEDRCREIVKLVAGPTRYELMYEVNNLFGSVGREVEYDDEDEELVVTPFTEPLLWTGTDPAPRMVGPDHFYSYFEPDTDVDPVFGLVMKVYFGGAIRMQPMDSLEIQVRELED